LSPKTDEELMVMYQNGDEAAFRILYERHSGKIYGYIKKRIAAAERCQDIFQNVFVKLHRSKELYNRQFAVLPWLFTITKNTLIDETRKNKRIGEHLQIDNLDLPQPLVDVNLDRSSLGSTLNHLPAQQKLALEMRYFDEKSFADIAARLETTEVNVRKILSRGVQRLKDLIKKEDVHE
jgi:RNA polymerase sigma factor (sigma-70 family)